MPLSKVEWSDLGSCLRLIASPLITTSHVKTRLKVIDRGPDSFRGIDGHVLQIIPVKVQCKVRQISFHRARRGLTIPKRNNILSEENHKSGQSRAAQVSQSSEMNHLYWNCRVSLAYCSISTFRNERRGIGGIFGRANRSVNRLPIFFTSCSP